MAAYESWAGGKVGSGADSTSWSLKPRGGYVPLADIPNAPKTVDMPLPKYQAIPSIRHEYVKQDVDMESRAQKLMQKPLPGSFEEAGEIRTASAGKGQMAWGKAIGTAGEEVSKAVTTLGTTMARLHGEAVKSQDETDVFRYDKMERDLQKRIDAIPSTLPPAEWQAKADELKKEFAKSTANLGRSQVTKDRIRLRTDSMVGTPGTPGWVDTHMQIIGDSASLKRDLDFRTESIQENRRTGEVGENAQHYAYMKDKGYYTDDQVKLESEKDDQIVSQGNFATAMQTNPRATMEEAEKVMTTGAPSKDFPHLNKNNAANAFVQARSATNEADQVAETDVSNQIANGQLVNEDQIRLAAKQRNLPGVKTDPLVRSFKEYREKERKNAEAGMVLDPAAVVGARSIILDYDANGDPTGEKFTAGVAYINSNLPPDMRAEYISKLRAKSLKEEEKKTPEVKAREREVESLSKEIKTLGEAGIQFEDRSERQLFQKAQKKIKDGSKLEPNEMAVWRKGNQWIDDRLNDLDADVAKEPDFAPGDLRTKTREKMAPEIQKNIGTTNPPAPPPAATVSTSGVTSPTKEQLAAAPGIVPSEWVAGAPRDINKESASFQQAWVSSGERYTNVTFTAFNPLSKNTKLEGGNRIATRGGPVFTVEGYQRGTFPYVSAAVDQKGELAGKYFISVSHPNVVMKGEDTGDAFIGAGESKIDVAFEDPAKETDYKLSGDVKIISEAEALAISGAQRRGGSGVAQTGGVVPQLASRVEALRQRFPNMGETTSGYRDPGHNLRVGGAGDSEHTRGDAMDISVANMPISERLRLIESASSMGIKGIGVYENSVHFDLGTKHGARAWGHSHRRASVPSWAEGVIRAHERRYGVG